MQMQMQICSAVRVGRASEATERNGTKWNVTRAEQQEFELSPRVLLVLLELLLDLLIDATRLARLLRQAAIERLEHRAAAQATHALLRCAATGATATTALHYCTLEAAGASSRFGRRVATNSLAICNAQHITSQNTFGVLELYSTVHLLNM